LATLELQQVHKAFGSAAVIHGVDLQVADGEFCVFVGPSGCGKSTLLRLIAGLEECSRGRVLIDGLDVTDAQPARRGIAMVFQSYALYPHMSVEQNMGFGLKMAKVASAEIGPKVRRVAQTLRIEHLLQRRPKDLSGGQRQRVAIGRAIVREPKLFLLDEPLSNLDAALRVEMRVELANIKSQVGTTFIYVTHDQVEAMTLADKIVVLRDGRIEQVGRPLELYAQPANQFVAGFIGSPKMNFLDASVSEANGAAVTVNIDGQGSLALPCIAVPTPASRIMLGVRPEHLKIIEPQRAHLQGVVSVAERLGGETFLHVHVGQGHHALVKVEGNSAVAVGQPVGLHITMEQAHLFASDGQRLSAA
jgi:ABC-type sugar transport system ATPase subunit